MIVSTKVLNVIETIEQLDIAGTESKRQIVQYRLVPNGELLAENDSFYNPKQMEQALLQLHKENQEMRVRLTPISTPVAKTPIEQLTESLKEIEDANTGIQSLEVATQEARRKKTDSVESADRALKTIANGFYIDQPFTGSMIEGGVPKE